MHEPTKAEIKAQLKEEKKIGRLVKRSAWSMGIGVGMLVLKIFIAPYLGDNPSGDNAMTLFGWVMVIYGGLLMFSFLCMRKFMYKVDFVLTYAFMPVIFVKLVMMIT